MQNNQSQSDFLMEYFKKHPNKDIDHPKIVDWVTTEYKKRTGLVFRDPDRGIRKLHQNGYLVKVRKGVYRYDPKFIRRQGLEDFTSEVKEQIFKRDGYRCVVCGNGRKEGVEIHADHMKAKDLGGKATLENGQTLCAKHNFLKKNLGQTEFGKKYFIRLYSFAKKEEDEKLIKFCAEILDVFETNNMDSHIEWNK
ncbi:MAG: HNH endonuclease [Patescibacteria group bacterium]